MSEYLSIQNTNGIIGLNSFSLVCIYIYIYTILMHMYYTLNIYLTYSLCRYMCGCMLSRFNCVWLFMTTDCSPQAPVSIAFSRQECWSGLPCSPPGNLPDLWIEPVSLVTPKLQVDSLPLSHQGSPYRYIVYIKYIFKTIYIHIK